MSFHLLPNEIIVKIFNAKISLQRQLQLRLVCSRWRDLIENMYKHKQSLKIFETRICVTKHRNNVERMSPSEVPHYEMKPRQNDVVLILHTSDFSKLSTSPTIFALLVRLFPNVKHLIAYLNPQSLFQDLFCLLSQYCPNLVSLYLFAYDSDSKNFVNKLKAIETLKVINKMNSLAHLHLYFNGFVNIYSDTKRGPNPDFIQLAHHLDNILPQLKSLSLSGFNYTFNSFNSTSIECPTFEKEVSLLGPKCTNLRLEWINYLYYSLPKVLQSSVFQSHPYLGDNLTHLSLVGVDSHQNISRHLHSLQYLFIEFEDTFYLNCVVYSLVETDNLSFLTELRIENYFYLDKFFTNVANRADFFPSQSVTKLTIGLASSPLEIDYEQLCNVFSSWFPRTEYLNISPNSLELRLQIDSHLNKFPHLKHFQ